MRCIHLIISSILLVLQFSVYSQNTIPKEHQPEEYISLNKDVTLNDALEIINQLSTKYANKIIIDRKGRKGTIGVTVDNMHWKRALEYILNSNLLEYVEYPRYYEVVEKLKQNEKKCEQTLVTHNSREIEIKAIFFEADYQTLSEVGVDWSTLKSGRVKINSFSNFNTLVTEDLYTFASMYDKKDVTVGALIRAFESSNKGEIIATPQIRILEGEKGKIKVGKNFYLTTKDFAGNTRYSEYESGTILTVVPQIVKHENMLFIHLQIVAERSDVVPSTVQVTKKITEGRTEVLLINGEETAIAGLFKNESSITRKGLPVLKDLPWWFFGLRYLFGYNAKQQVRKELIVLIQANIVPNLTTRLKSKIKDLDHLIKGRKEFQDILNRLK